ncbi:hypothetical protein AAGW05_06080 [Arthrobacter sp. LAPM80]|uniref:hypothetical protein n=1 Tax=Arthrobacter sp. LAPM80 TaxID=3141788 RepID=UPI00398AD5C7
MTSAVKGDAVRFAQGSSWSMTLDASWPLTVALHIRDALSLPATRPFFVPPVVPKVPERIPVIGPTSDIALADEWSIWFADLVRSRAGMQSPDELLLEGRHPMFQEAVQGCLLAGQSAAEQFKLDFHEDFVRSMKKQAGIPARIVRGAEKDLGREAPPFELVVRVVPVAGEWLYRHSPSVSLISSAAFLNPAAQRRLLEPVLRDLV